MQYAENAWADRVRSLKNVLPELHFLQDSGPAIVSWNIAIRIVAAFLPAGAGIIHRFIIDGVNRIRFRQPLPRYFWRLVGGEMCLAILVGVLTRAVDYFDNLLADRIVVLEKGRLAEKGSHSRLMSIDGCCAAMFEMQAASYR